MKKAEWKEGGKTRLGGGQQIRGDGMRLGEMERVD